jgi:hypothetical protein
MKYFIHLLLACSRPYHSLPSIAIYVGKALDMVSLKFYWPRTSVWNKGVNIKSRFVLFSKMQVEMRPPSHTSILFTKQVFVVLNSITTHPTKCRVDHPHNKFKSVGLQAG